MRAFVHSGGGIAQGARMYIAIYRGGLRSPLLVLPGNADGEGRRGAWQ